MQKNGGRPNRHLLPATKKLKKLKSTNSWIEIEILRKKAKMVNAMVEKATSDMLIGPDWAMNIEICDMCNHDPVQAKDVVKGIKKRIGSKNPKVQLFALTLLETIVKNCGDIVHLHVADKHVLHEMVKIAKKKPDFQVKEKILTLIDTWQDAFGGARARYPQYYAAYQELLRAGAVFPQRSETSAPVFTPPQTQPLASYPQNLRNDDYPQVASESSAESEFPTLSLTEVQNARGIMDVLAEMLNAIDPSNKAALRQEVLIDLVEQCRTFKQRVVHLVNSTSDESLLCQGLSLNDDLQRVLAKHEAFASGTPAQKEEPKPNSSRALVDIGGPLVDAGDIRKRPEVSTSSSGAGSTLNQLLLTAPPATNGSTSVAAVSSKIDLLSGDDYISPKVESLLALVPLGEPQPTTPPSQQNALVLFDMFSNSNPPNGTTAHPPVPVGQTSSTFPSFQQPQSEQSPQAGIFTNGSAPTMGSPQFDQSQYLQGTVPAWNGQLAQPQQPASPVYGTQSGGSLPPPPWEAPQADASPVSDMQYPRAQVTQVVFTHSQPVPGVRSPPVPMGSEQLGSAYIQPVMVGSLPITNNQAVPGSQFVGLQPQIIQGGQYVLPQQMQVGQMTAMYPQQMYGNQMAAYGYGQQQGGHAQLQGTRYLEQQMYGLSIRDDSALRNSSYQFSSSSQVGPGKPSKPEDKLFGDLVDITKFRQTKRTAGRIGSM